MIKLAEVGAHVVADGPLRVRFGVYLPTITWAAGFRLKVLVIHEQDQFMREVPSREFYLAWDSRSAYDLWSVEAELIDGPAHFGDAGTYLYRKLYEFEAASCRIMRESQNYRDFAAPLERLGSAQRRCSTKGSGRDR